jgi:CRP-like cAMP-binding protein/membrane protein YdbS with pleckstrin-like domain
MANPTTGDNNGQGQGGHTRAAPHTPVRELIQQIPFLVNLSTTEVVDVLVSSTEFRRFRAGDILTAQDAPAEYLYYLVEGTVRITRTRLGRDRQLVPVIDRIAGAGVLLGRLALIYNLPYTSQAKAETDGLALRFRTSALERLLFRFPDIRAQIVPQAIINRLRTMPLFKDVGLVTLSYLAEEVEVKPIAAGQTIYTQNDKAETLYLIHRGQVELYHPRRAKEVLWLGTGSPFGFPGSIGPSSTSQTHYGHWAITSAPTIVYKVPWESVRRVAKRFPQLLDASIQFRPYETIKKVSVFENFNDLQKRRLAGFCSFHHIPQHHLILQQGDIGDSMWILLAGGKAVLSALDKNDRALPRTPVTGIVYFHETALRAARDVRSTVETEPGSLWLRLHWQDFQQYLKGEKVIPRLKIQLPEDEMISGKESSQNYAWLGQGEVVVSRTHRHWIALLEKLRLSAFLLLGSLVLIALGRFVPDFFHWIVGLAMLFFIPTLIWGILDHLNDYFIVTNQRIIQQEKVIFITEYRREALLEQIERVDVQTSFWGNMLGYGSLKIFTAGTTGFIEFDLVPDPDKLKSEIFRERSLRHMRYRAESKLEIQNALERRLGLTLELPSRVHAADSMPKPSPTATQKPGWWQRFWWWIFQQKPPAPPTDRKVWRQHWLILLRKIAIPAILTLLLLALMIAMLSAVSIALVENVQNFILGFDLILIIPLLLTVGWLIYQILDWWNDTYEITTDRIIDVEKLPFFLKEVRREAPLAQIQDVTYRISSPIEMLFNYGDVVIQTAASQGALTFDHISKPREVKDEINRRVVAWRRSDEQRKARDQVRDLPDWFYLYNRLEAGMEPARLATEEESNYQDEQKP